LECYAEIGIWRGDTTEAVAKAIPAGGTIHLFDYTDVIDTVLKRLNKLSKQIRIVPHANTRKLRDSYNWSLMQMLRTSAVPIFDYIYLDGAHCYDTDALAFFLLDKLLKVGGYIELDDYTWTHDVSMTNHCKQMRAAGKADAAHLLEETLHGQFTDTQLKTSHIGEVVDLLVKPMPNYTEIVADRIYRKTDILAPRSMKP